MTYLSAVRNINAQIQNVETKAPVSSATRQHQIVVLLWFENHSLRQFLARRTSNREMCAQARTATCLLPKTLPQPGSQEHICPLDCVWLSLAASMGRMEELV